MKIFKLTIILSLIFVACNQEKHKSQLVGNWFYESELTDFIEFKFYNDSVIIKDRMGLHKAKWKANSKQLKFKIIQSDWNQNDEITYNYLLLNNKQELFLRVYGDTILEFENFVKAKDSISFVNKKTN